MAQFVLLDEVHIHLSVPRNLADEACAEIRRTLLRKSFLTAVRRGVCQICRRYPTLAKVRVRVAR